MMTRFAFYSPDRRRDLETRVAEYAFEQPDPTPWTPLRRRLSESVVSIVTTAGLRLVRQHQFAADRDAGCPEYREISLYVKPADLAYDFTNYDPTEAQNDLNVLVPVDRLREMVDEKEFAGLTETFFSFFGRCLDIPTLKRNAEIVAERMKTQGSDVAFVFTANLMCNQTAGIIARALERCGVSTVMLATVHEMAEQVKVPRTVFVNHPFGRPLGRAGDARTQRAVLDEMTAALKKLSRPGKIQVTDFTWEGEVGY